MGGTYFSSNHCAIAYNDVAEEMQEKKVRPENVSITQLPPK